MPSTRPTAPRTQAARAQRSAAEGGAAAAPASATGSSDAAQPRRGRRSRRPPGRLAEEDDSDDREEPSPARRVRARPGRGRTSSTKRQCGTRGGLCAILALSVASPADRDFATQGAPPPSGDDPGPESSTGSNDSIGHPAEAGEDVPPAPIFSRAPGFLYGLTSGKHSISDAELAVRTHSALACGMPPYHSPPHPPPARTQGHHVCRF